MPHRNTGQPCKLLKPGVKEKLLSAISKGASYNLTCGYAGIAYQTFRDWIKRGEALLSLTDEEIESHPHKVYYDLLCDVKRVEAYAALKWLEKIDEASNFHWQAAAWKLERRHPEEFGRYDKDARKDESNSDVDKARSEVSKLKGEGNGSTTPAASGSVI